jgi:acid phosphatase family membrane protein YuiD
MRRKAIPGSIRLVLLVSLLVPVVGRPSAAQVPEPPPPPSLGEVFGEVPRDLWRFLNWDTAKILAIGGGAAGIGHIWDDEFADEVETNARLNDAFGAGATYGAFTVQTLIGVGLYTGGRIGKKGKLAQVGGDVMRAQILSQVYVQGLKYTVRRERPDASNHHSFPSGHSASVFATAGVLQRNYGWKVGVPANVIAAYVAASRVHDNRHYLSDVIFGAAMGIAAEHTVSMHSGRYAWDVMPVGGPDHVGVMVAVHAR